jgi:hypothetical protein
MPCSRGAAESNIENRYPGSWKRNFVEVRVALVLVLAKASGFPKPKQA